MAKNAFLLPDVGEGVAEAEVVRWLVQVGERVEPDQAVVEVQTDKAVVELPSAGAGWIGEICYQEGEVAPVGDVLFVLETTDPQKKNATNQKSLPKRVLAAPTVRRAARDLGISLQEVQGSGPNGRVIEEDLQRYLLQKQSNEIQSVSAAQVSPTLQSELTLISEQIPSTNHQTIDRPLSPVRRVIADRLSTSVQTKPHVTHFAELDVTGIVEWRKRRLLDRDKGENSPTSYLTILLRCIASALQVHPLFNSHFLEEEQKIRTFPSIHFGIATDTDQGLLVPVLRDVEQKETSQISVEIEQLVKTARLGKLIPAQLKGSTFTISNAGTLGGDWATPILNPPEVAILALHPIVQKPIVTSEGELAIGWRMNVSLTFDHRVLDGADAIRFTNTLNRYTSDLTRLI
ncbi:dihydrolipoamide acetyltransferase family protein [Risungbinella massiliensis]|uniref:dihydrolipoamide acetyltransferase family protein n=1 Tax=Risungbinella massiliensis TaxID=1329796 RepID=UPI0005CBD5D9|nr:dihydrolipoamide acetyltransferase family protein [Risungbinella massiliensis]